MYQAEQKINFRHETLNLSSPAKNMFGEFGEFLAIYILNRNVFHNPLLGEPCQGMHVSLVLNSSSLTNDGLHMMGMPELQLLEGCLNRKILNKELFSHYTAYFDAKNNTLYGLHFTQRIRDGFN